MLYSVLYIRPITSKPMNRVSAPVTPPSRTTASRLTASSYSFNLARSWPPSACPNSLDHSFPVHLRTRSITATKCISKLARSQPRNVSLTSHDYSLQVGTITASQCISELTRSRLPSSHDHGLQVHLQTCPIAASKYISQSTRSRPPGASLSSLDQGLPVHLQTHSIMASKCISELHDLGLQMHLPTHSITASKCISKFNSISASKCISKLARSRPPSTSPSSHDHGLQVHL
jgi:hypothetical protein